MSNINFDFISKLEGGATCTGYVPDAQHSKSGVTIATGFDIGQRSSDDLHLLLPEQIALKLTHYCGAKGMQAAALLANSPLLLTEPETKVIDTCVKAQLVKSLVHKYNRVSSVPFGNLPECAQTVIASVAFQYGNLAKRCPTFWGLVITQNWQGMVNELTNFGDRYTSRRISEANYFISGVKA